MLSTVVLHTVLVASPTVSLATLHSFVLLALLTHISLELCAIIAVKDSTPLVEIISLFVGFVKMDVVLAQII